MAKQTITIYTDDVTGERSDDIHTVMVVAGDGIAYAVDMAETTYAQYESAIAPYVSAGRRIGRMPKAASGSVGNVIPIGRATSTETRPDYQQNKAIREWWGRNQGRDSLPPLVERGRIPQSVLDAFQKHRGLSIAPAPIETPPEPPIEPAKKARAARSVGAEVHVNGPAFLAPEAAQPEVAPARKRASAAKASPAKAARGKTATATVKGKPQPAARRTGRRATAS